MNVCHIFWTVISGQIGRFSIRFPISRAGLGGVQRPNCSHNMRDVTAFVSPLSNHRCLTAPRTPREIIPSGHHSLSFPLHLAKNILKDIKRINLFDDQWSYKMKTHEQWPASTSSTSQQWNKVFCSFEKILYPWVCTVICILYNEFAPSLAPHSIASLRKWVTSCADGLFTRRHICSRPHLGFARYCQIVGTAQHYQLHKVQNFQRWSKLSNPNWFVIMLLAAQWCSEVPGNTRGRRPLTF